jgi:hypothetical protein
LAEIGILFLYDWIRYQDKRENKYKQHCHKDQNIKRRTIKEKPLKEKN